MSERAPPVSGIQILAIATAQPGWYAKFSQPDGSDLLQPVIVWAVVQDPDDTQRMTSFSMPSASQATRAGGGPVVQTIPDHDTEGFIHWQFVP